MMALFMKTLRGCEAIYQNSLNKVIHWITSADDVALLFHNLSHLLDMEIAFISIP